MTNIKSPIANLGQLLNSREYFLYEKFLYRKTIKDKRRKIENELKEVMIELNKYSDVNIWKELWVSKQAIWQLKTNLQTKCKRLWINFKI